MKNYRDSSLDAACGLFIVYMIVGHAFQWSFTTSDSFYKYSDYVLFMFMPWFFFKSGMFYKKQKSVKLVIHKCIKKLIVPYLVYSAVGEIVFWVSLY